MLRIVCLLLFCTIFQISADTYDAIVVEGRPPGRSITENLKDYEAAIDQTMKKKKTVRIIVLPEFGLTGMVDSTEDMKTNAITFKDTSEKNITAINDLAKKYNAYIVANVLEKQENQYYSTSVVLNGTSNIVAKYRSVNGNSTFKDLNVGSAAVTFSTKFGTFGLLSGHDLLYESPSKDLLQNEDVTNIIVTSSLKSKLPYNAALSVQQGYAQAKGVNLLVASLNDPDKGYGGSGIYSANKIINSYISADVANDVLEGSLPILDKRSTCQEPDKIKFPLLRVTSKPISDFKLEYQLGEIQLADINKDGTKKQKLCSDDFCCYFTVPASDLSENYRLAVQAAHPKFCLVLLCDKDKQNCGNYTESIKTKFNNIEITADKDDSSFIPYSLTSKLTPIDLPANPVYYCQNNDGLVFNVSQEVSSLIAFGIVSTTESGSSTIQMMFGIQIFTFMLVLKYFI